MKKFVVVLHCESETVSAQDLNSLQWWMNAQIPQVNVTHVQGRVDPKLDIDGHPRRGTRGNVTSSSNASRR